MVAENIPNDPIQNGRKQQVRTMRKPLLMLRKGTAAGGSRTRSLNKSELKSEHSDVVNKRISSLLEYKEKLEAKAVKLGQELKRLQTESNYAQQEKDLLQQFWEHCRSELDTERRVTLELEKKMQRMRTTQAARLSDLHKKMRVLTLNTTMSRPNCSQTESLQTSTDKKVDCKDTQTQEIFTNEKASKILRETSDELLTSFVAELQKAKLNAESELKFSVATLEQRMKMDMDFELRRREAEQERKLNEQEMFHEEEIRRMKHEHSVEVQDLQGKVEYLQTELTSVRESNDQLTRSLQDARDQVTDQRKSFSKMQLQLEDTSKELQKLKDYKDTYQRDIRNVERMRKEAAKYKDINQIIMGEFALLEQERDELLAQLEKGVARMERLNGQRYLNLKRRTEEMEKTLLGTTEKSLESEQ